jgi:hypothetical protein
MPRSSRKAVRQVVTVLPSRRGRRERPSTSSGVVARARSVKVGKKQENRLPHRYHLSLARRDKGRMNTLPCASPNDGSVTPGTGSVG